MIDAEKLGSVFDCDVHSLPSVIAQCYGHYVPCFRVDIPALEMKYAQVYLSRKTVKFLSQLSAKDMDREFLIAIEKEFLDRVVQRKPYPLYGLRKYTFLCLVNCV